MTVYALKHPDGRWLYHLPKPTGRGFYSDDSVPLADGQPMTALPSGWWATDHEAVELTWPGKPLPETIRYELRDQDAESVRFPATLSVEAYLARREDDDSLYGLYSPVTVDRPAEVHVYDGPITVLEGREPPAQDEPPWQAELPYELGNRPEYRHLFPGAIPDLREYLYKTIDRMPRVRHCFKDYQGYRGLTVILNVPFDKPRTRWQANIGRQGQKLKTGKTVPDLARRELQLPIPFDVRADTYEQALAEWNQQVEFWTGVVKDASVAACSACDGHGYVPTGADQFTPSK